MSSNDFLEELDLFEWFRDVVDTSIHNMIIEKLGMEESDAFHYGRVKFYPIYTRCTKSDDKVLKALNILYVDNHSEYIQLTIDDIEKTGASWQEFVDFLVFSDAKLVYYKNVL